MCVCVFEEIVHYVTCVNFLLLLLLNFIFYFFVKEINDMQESSSEMVTTEYIF